MFFPRYGVSWQKVNGQYLWNSPIWWQYILNLYDYDYWQFHQKIWLPTYIHRYFFFIDFIKVLSLNHSVCIQPEMFTAAQKTFDPDFTHILTNKVSIEAFLWATSTFKGTKVFKVETMLYIYFQIFHWELKRKEKKDYRHPYRDLK